MKRSLLFPLLIGIILVLLARNGGVQIRIFSFSNADEKLSPAYQNQVGQSQLASAQNT